MACGCGKRAALPRWANAAPVAPQAAKLPASPPKMVRIIYQGPIGSHLVPSPMRLVRTYGLHTRGDSFDVHEADQQAKPGIFVRAEGTND